MQTHNEDSLKDGLKVVKHSRSTGKAVSLQIIAKRVFGGWVWH